MRRILPPLQPLFSPMSSGRRETTTRRLTWRARLSPSLLPEWRAY